MADSLSFEKTKEEADFAAAQRRDHREAALPSGVVDPVFEAKAQVLNNAIQSIGMGKYQWLLFVVVGFGWASDNLWPIATSLILSPVAHEFSPRHPAFLSLAQNIGLLVGAVFWGFGCDVFGRKWAFNLTLGTTAVFGMLAASSPNFVAVATFAALWSVGVGGNLPVDSAIFLEFLPASHQHLLTVLSIFWAFAQVFATLVAWPLLGHLTCQQTATTCPRSDNMGWRYFLIAIGGVWVLLFVARFLFPLYESPKFLMGRGRDEDAVRVVYEVAKRNGQPCDLTVDQLTVYDRRDDDSAFLKGPGQGTSAQAAIRRKLEKVDFNHVKALFATPKSAYSIIVVTLIWAFIGLAFPLYNSFLPFVQAQKGAEFGDGSTYITYRNSLIIAVLGVPGALLGGILVELPKFGRRGSLALSTALTGIFIICSTTALTSSSLLGWNCAYSFSANIMYAVLYAYTPEIFPTQHRGTGNALTATANRIFGILAPIIATYADLSTSVPVYVAGALFIVSGLLAVILPFEPRGKASL